MSETVFPSTVTFQFPLYFCEIYTEFFLRFIYFLMVAIFPSSVKWKKWKDQWNIYKWTWKTEKQTIWISSNFHKTIFLSSLSFSVSIFFQRKFTTNPFQRFIFSWGIHISILQSNKNEKTSETFTLTETFRQNRTAHQIGYLQ